MVGEPANGVPAPMKVVLFCGGLGVRMGDETQRTPKPMIAVGNRPIVWQIMKYYAAWGHRDFILCLGYKAESIKEYFLAYNEAYSNDFVLSNGGRDVHLLASDISDWRITFVDTGTQATIGDRLLAVAPHLDDDEYFLATYGDGLTDAPLDDMIGRLEGAGKTGLFLSVRPTFSAHVVQVNEDGLVHAIDDIQYADVWINGGFFVFRRDILDADPAGRGARRGAVPPTDPERRADRISIRGFLRPDGHDEGQAAARRARGQRPRALAPGRAPGIVQHLMLGATLVDGDSRLRRVLALGAHADDIEIGCGATLLTLQRAHELEVTWVVLAANGEREEEARASADLFLARAASRTVVCHGFRDGFLPHVGGGGQGRLRGAQARGRPELVFTHARSDLHQDHRFLCELTWNTWREHLILEYEIPKYDGDLGTPNVFVPVSEEVAREKAELVTTAFPSQREKHWFDAELFLGLMRVRGMEARSPSGYAEAFTCRKLSLLAE